MGGGAVWTHRHRYDLGYEEQDQRKESWEKSIRFRKIHFCSLFKKIIWNLGEQKLYTPQRALGTFSLSFVMRKKSTRVFLHRTNLSYPASRVLLEIKGKQTDHPTSCQINTLLINMLSFQSSSSANNNSPLTLGYNKNRSSVLSIAIISNNSSSFR